MYVVYIDNDAEDFELFLEAAKTVNPNVDCLYLTNGRDAINLLSKTSSVPEYIFLDVNMPIMSGRECLVKLKQIPALQSVPVFMYSTSSNPKEIANFKDLGAADFIVKPSTYTRLIQILEPLLVLNAAYQNKEPNRRLK